MAITDLLLWANDIEDNRLPAVEADQLRLDTLISAKVQEFGDKLDQHNARINNNFQGYNAARGQADYALTRIYETGLQAQTYTDAQIQLLRDELASLIGGIGAYVNGGGLTDSLNAQIATQTTGLTALVNAATQEVLAVRDQISLDLADIRSANEDILNTVLPDQSQTIQTINQDLTTVKTDVDLVLAGFDYDTLIEGLDAVRSRVADQIAPLGVSVPQDPSSAWTTESRSTVLSPKAPLPPSWLKTNDPVLGSCAELTAGAAVVIGQAAPVEFAPDRVYRVRARVRTVGNGSSGGAKISLGVTTFAGSAVAENAAPKVAATALAASSSTSTVFTCVFSTNLAKLQAQGYSIGSGVNDQAVQLVTSGSANKAFFYLMQNEGGTTNGQVRVGLLEVKDITDAIDAAKIVETKLDTKFDEAMASVNSLSYVVTEQGVAIAANRTALETSINNVSANLSANYYTKVATDAAISASATTLNSSISNVQAAVSNAQSTADGKGKVFYSTSAPAVSEQLSQNLWIDLTGGANTPKRWNGTAWQAVTDKVATDAAAAAATAQTGVTNLSSNLTNNYYTKTATDAAIASASTTLSSQITTAQQTADGKGKVLFQSTTPAAADQLAQNLWIDTTGSANTPKRWNGSAWVAVTDKVASDAAASVTTINANLTANYYTKTATDSAISASTTALKTSMESSTGSIGILSNTLTNDYYTKTGTDAQISAASTNLTSVINSEIVFANGDPDFREGLTMWGQSGNGADPMAISVASTRVTTRASTDSLAGGMDIVAQGYAALFSRQFFLIDPRRTYKLTARVKREAYVSGNARLYLGFRCLTADGVTSVGTNSGNKYAMASGLLVAAFPVGDFVEFTATITGEGTAVNQFNAGTQAIRLLAYLNYSETTAGNVMAMSRFALEDVTNAKAEADAVTANLTNNYYTKTATDSAIAAADLSLKAAIESPTGSSLGATLANTYYTKTATDSAIASQITTYNASVAGGLTATVTSQGSAISTLQNNAAASLLFRTKAGTAGAELELVSASSPSGSASSARISAQNLILDGTVTFTQQSYGGGGNLLRNTDFGSGTLHWDVEGTGTVAAQTNLSVLAAGQAWAGTQYPTLMLFQNGSGVDGTKNLFTNFWKDNATQSWVGPAVSPNQWYELSTQISTHRCTAQLIAQFFDSTLAFISSTVVASQTNTAGSSSNPDSWARIGGKVQAPANAAYMRMVVTKGGTLSGTSSYVFLHKPYVGVTHSAATALSPYVSNGVTIIDGATIKTGSITAASAVIADATIGTAKIQNGAVTNRFAAFTAAAVALTSTYTLVQSLTIDAAGNPVSLLFNGGFGGGTSIQIDVRVDGVSQRVFQTSSGFYLDSSGFSGTAIGTVNSSGYNTMGGSVSFNYANVGGNVFVSGSANIPVLITGAAVQFYENLGLVAMVINPAAGSRSIQVYARVNGGYSSSPYVNNRFLETTELKR